MTSPIEAALRRVASALRSARRPSVPRLDSRHADIPSTTPAPDAGPLGTFGSLIPTRAERTVVILAHSGARRQVGPWLAVFSGDRVHVIASEPLPEWPLGTDRVFYHRGVTLDQLSWRVRLIGAVDVLVDLQPGTLAKRRTVWRRLFYYLRPDGAYIIDQSAASEGGFGKDLSAWMTSIGDAADPDQRDDLSAKDREFAASVASISASRDLVVLTKRQHHYVKLRDAHASRALTTRRGEGVRVSELAKLPPGTVDVRATVTSHEASVDIPWLAPSLPYPALRLRRYTGRVGFAGATLMFGESTILPDSFRHHLDTSPTNPRMVNVSAGFARIPADLLPTETLSGSFYQLDSSYPGHFGHLTTEVLSRFWGWDIAKAADPNLKVLLSGKAPFDRDPALERRLLTAYGIGEEDIVQVDRPLYLESVVSASPMWHNENPHYVHPAMVDVWNRLGEHLIDWSAPRYDRIFVSRATLTPRRTCRNVLEVEAFFVEHGFTIIYPEQLDLAVQAGVFAQASTIAGFGGSALFNIMYAKKMSTLIILSHEAYTARNEHLFSALLGGDVHYFWSTPDVSHPVGGWSQDAFYSDWEFDFDRNRTPVEELLRSL